MVRYATRRVLALIPTLFGVSVVVFVMIHLIPGDPASAFLRENASAEDVARVTERLGLNKPLPQQYVEWLGRILRLDLGESLHTSLPVAGQLAAQFPATAELAIAAIVMATVPLAVIARQTRSAMLEILHQDYVRTAWAKGLRERRIVLRHVMKNALLPVITIVGLQVGLLLSGAFLTETVFSWPGLATYVVAAINGRDYPVVQGTVLLFAVIFVFVNLVVDLSYAWLDPRIKYS